MGIIAYMIVALGFVNSKHKSVVCQKLNVVILDSLENSFVSTEDIKEILNNNEINTLGCPVDELNTKEIETILNDFESIRKAEVYTTIDGVLHILITQRQPIVRILNNRDISYYIDDEGKIIPSSKNNSAFILVVNGHINESFNIKGNINIHEVCDERSVADKLLLDIFKISKFINDNEFWKAQIEQVYATRSGEFELVPRVGAHLLLFGTADNYREKFYKLRIFYEKGLNMYGWNRYEIINLKYKNQIVCTKR